MQVRQIQGYGQDGSIIKEAAMCCYGLRESSRDISGYILMLKQNGHHAMLEFSWFPIELTDANWEDVLHLFIGSYVKVHKTSNVIICLGNGRAWMEWLDRMHTTKLSTDAYMMYRSIWALLHQANGDIFPRMVYPQNIRHHIGVELKDNGKSWYCFKVSGTSRGLTHQLVRHRSLSFAQVSSRYVNMGNYECTYRKSSPEIDAIFEKSFQAAMCTYNELIEKGVKKDDARQVLPTGIATDIFVAGDMAAWANFLYLRDAEKAHWEIKELAGIIRDTIFPSEA